jgi:hypothetical protein
MKLVAKDIPEAAARMNKFGVLCREFLLDPSNNTLGVFLDGYDECGDVYIASHVVYCRELNGCIVRVERDAPWSKNIVMGPVDGPYVRPIDYELSIKRIYDYDYDVMLQLLEPVDKATWKIVPGDSDLWGGRGDAYVCYGSHRKERWMQKQCIKLMIAQDNDERDLLVSYVKYLELMCAA